MKAIPNLPEPEKPFGQGWQTGCVSRGQVSEVRTVAGEHHQSGPPAPRCGLRKFSSLNITRKAEKGKSGRNVDSGGMPGQSVTDAAFGG